MADAAPERDWTNLPAPILQLFGRHLSAPALKQSLESCKSWREPVRHGVQSFAVSFPADDPAVHDQALAGQQAAQKLATLGTTFPALKHLQVAFFCDPDTCTEHIASLAASLPTLQELRLCFQPEESEAVVARSLHQVLAPLTQLQHLKSLHLETHMALADSAWLQTIARLPQLETLVLHLNLQLPSTDLAITALQPLASLQHFQLHMAFMEPPSGVLPTATISKEALEQLAASWPRLRSLSLTASPWDFASGFCSSLRRFQRLEALCLSVQEPYEYASQPPAPTVSARLYSIPSTVQAAKLTNISLVGGVMARPASATSDGDAEAPIDPPQLEILELLGCVYNKTDLAAALAGCPCLRSMVADRVALAGEELAKWQEQR